MRDETLRHLLRPTNLVMVAARWERQDGWIIRNLTVGRDDFYDALEWADKNVGKMHTIRKELKKAGAVAIEFSIMRPEWNEIEELQL